VCEIAHEQRAFALWSALWPSAVRRPFWAGDTLWDAAHSTARGELDIGPHDLKKKWKRKNRKAINKKIREYKKYNHVSNFTDFLHTCGSINLCGDN